MTTPTPLHARAGLAWWAIAQARAIANAPDMADSATRRQAAAILRRSDHPADADRAATLERAADPRAAAIAAGRNAAARIREEMGR